MGRNGNNRPLPPATCSLPNGECDGRMHYTAVWDEDEHRWYPIDSRCPRSSSR